MLDFFAKVLCCRALSSWHVSLGDIPVIESHNGFKYQSLKTFLCLILLPLLSKRFRGVFW
jgi:hypothetical protein